MDDSLDWLPINGVVLTREDLAQVFVALRALVNGTAPDEPNRVFATEVVVTRALERDGGLN
jgi:hypothetical protein